MIGLAAHALTGGRRDVASVAGPHAGSDALLVDDAYAGRANQMLSRS